MTNSKSEIILATLPHVHARLEWANILGFSRDRKKIKKRVKFIEWLRASLGYFQCFLLYEWQLELYIDPPMDCSRILFLERVHCAHCTHVSIACSTNKFSHTQNTQQQQPQATALYNIIFYLIRSWLSSLYFTCLSSPCKRFKFIQYMYMYSSICFCFNIVIHPGLENGYFLLLDGDSVGIFTSWHAFCSLWVTFP